MEKETHKLTAEDKQKIVEMYESGNYSQKEIAEKFDLALENVNKIVKQLDKFSNENSSSNLSNELTKNDEDVKPHADDNIEKLREMLEDMLYFQRGDNMKNIQYIVDDKGKKIAVIMPIEEYERLLEDIHDLSIAKERINEPEEDLDDVIEELKNEGLLPHSYKTLSQERTKKNR